MIIIPTCPKCGADLEDAVLTVNPPLPVKHCPRCGWKWIGESEQTIRIPFDSLHNQICDKCGRAYSAVKFEFEDERLFAVCPYCNEGTEINKEIKNV